eukprot:TRINITY_DN9754_c0_g1_i1.p1 TRINITY_DN9754_c0_g1~~TRINITY_DN9754_c0_g1_i1.p1  ORF type:complete len:194 (+),score=22.65 TRINITY_DN9754_c0_g1_i1:63-644(+)
MPISHSSPARVPNFSYDTGPRDLFLLDSVVQRDMARTKRVIGTGNGSRPYAVEGGEGPGKMKAAKRVVVPRESTSWEPRHVTTSRVNHLQNAPSSMREPKKRLVSSRVNADSDPFSHRATDVPRQTKQSRINVDNNIFGPPVPAYTKPPPPAKEPFVQQHKPGHIRPTLTGMTDAYKFAPSSNTGGGAGTKFY